MILHDYWRSTASYRVRIALNFKGIHYLREPYDLRTGAHRTEAYRALNPQLLVPALEMSGGVLTQSPAILEWLEEHQPTPPLLPKNAEARAIVRSMAALVACDIHPLNNLRVIDILRTNFAAETTQVTNWILQWIGDGFAALETMIGRHGDGFAFGATPTLADCYLVPQVYSAERFGLDLSPYPKLHLAAQAAAMLEAFAAAHPDRQSDAS